MALLKFENVCRLCLRQEDSMSSIFDKQNGKNPDILAGRITSIAHVEISPKDGLPSSICQMCKSQVEQFYEFRLLVEISDRTLRQYLKSRVTAEESNNSFENVTIKNEDGTLGTMSYTLLLPNEDLELWDSNVTTEIHEKTERPLKAIHINKTADECIDNDSSENNVNGESTLDNIYCCELCLVNFQSLDELKNHVMKHCSINQSISKIKQTNNSKINIGKLQDNQGNNPQKSNQTNKKSGVGLIKCETCLQSFSKTYIARHNMRCGWRQIEFVCEECGKTFSKKSELRYHKGAHLPSPLMCARCNKQFRNVQSYNIHMKRHTVGSRFSCETCGKRYYTNSELARHVQKHADKRKHPCHLCDTAFLSRPELNRHMKYHNGVKRFRCHICSKCYYESGHLKVHMRVHTGEKPFACQCGKAFITKSKLLRHEKIHKRK